MKQFNFFTVALTALTLFSCAKENIDTPEGPIDGKTMEIRIAKNNVKSETRAGGDLVSDNYKTPIVGGKVQVFCFPSNVSTSPLLLKREITLAESASGYTGDLQVPSTTGYLYILANASEIEATVGSTTLQELRTRPLSVKDYQSIESVPMSNPSESIQNINKPENGNWSVEVAISPVMARIEVASIRALTEESESKITQFDLVGIYINNYYQSFTLDGKSNGDIVEPVTKGEELQAATVEPWSYDLYNGGLTQQTTYTEGTNDAWTYMLAPATGIANMPKIVLKLNNVKVNGQNHNLNYVTVKNFKDANSANAVIENLSRNTVYTIQAISFDASKTTIDPNQQDIDVNVTVTITDWQKVNVNPEI